MKKYIGVLTLLNCIGLLFVSLNILFEFISFENKKVNPILGVLFSLSMIFLSFKLNLTKKQKLNE